ncbi:ABC transporter substrate-binding protein [Actinomycetospora termitidis]|uniref:Thiamine pyrimidine synthase n=1 Tax=Actinomycetospora termitidis TaxID=3053470 RepID=A0ABT7M4G5_9PSEU|nr:ABC transporter substrate-binding protein [Actinomycetospora sp. Odt1-22]MDL5155565.1 ABC transporter substrate-binding protein [Actinomycetospora sp. Odt1-22]
MPSTPAASVIGRRSFLRWSGLAAGAVGGATLLAACGGGSDAGSAPAAPGSNAYGREAIQLSWIKNTEFAGEYMADSRGYYREAGFEGIDLLAGGSASTGVEANLVSGNCWAGLSAPALTAPAVLQGAPLKIVGATYQKNPFCIVSGAGNPIPEPRAMIGKRIGVQDSNDQVWNGLLRANGIDPAQITRVPVQFDAAPLTTGEIDGYLAYITNEPNSLTRRGFPNTTFLFADHGLPLVAETVTVLQETIDNERAKLKAFLRAEVRGWNDAVRDIPGVARLTVETYGRDLGLDIPGQVKEATDQNALVVTDDTRANGLFTMTDVLVEENLRALSLAGSTIAREQLFDLSLLTEVYAEDPSLRVALP